MEHFNEISLSNEIAVETIDYTNAYDFSKLHRHTYFEFLLFEIGEGGKQIIDFNEYEIASKSLYIIIPGQVHLMKRLPKENGVLIQCSKLFLNQSISPLAVDYISAFSLCNHVELADEQFSSLYLLFERIKTEYRRKTTFRNQKLSHLLGFIVLEMLELLKESVGQTMIDQPAYYFLQKVHNHIRDVRTVKEYAEMLNTPLNKLNKAVKLHFGKSPIQIIHEALLTEVKRLLLVEQLSHKEIAYMLNFDSQSSYSRFIKKNTSLSPSELKEKLRQIAH